MEIINDEIEFLHDKLDFERREWAFAFGKDNFLRKKQFDSLVEVKNFCKQKKPTDVYLGGLYSHKVPYGKEEDLDLSYWKGRELVFDIDLDNYDNVRFCECKGKTERCPICWSIMSFGAELLDMCLRLDFGYKNIEWVYSGRRGVHCWVLDEEVLTYDQVFRRAIISNLPLITDYEKDMGVKESIERALGPDKNASSFDRLRQTHAFQTLMIPFLRITEREYLEPYDFTKWKVNLSKFLKRRDKINDVDDFTASDFISALNRNKYGIVRHIYQRLVPRVDAAVTYDLRRLIRCPGSTHGATGQLVRRLESFEEMRNLVSDHEKV